ncbi:MAG: isoprenylcysteine carboxylmethyltransferase family protein [Candidatus Omnitrophica bacterium]|nr:isoprenylcysteine carboxylmethyltransferase family protein [Candidatus Omnitrophota bacterium]
MKKRIKINGVIIFLAVVVMALFPKVFFRQAGGLFGDVAEIFGIIFVLLGQVLRISARGYKAENSQNSHRLIQEGPYSLVRNPMYLGIFLIGFGVVLWLFQIWVIVVFLLFFIVRYNLLIMEEEEKLVKFFPQEYPVYQRNVPRILPNFLKLNKQDIAEYLPVKLNWIKKEINSIIPVLAVSFFIGAWKQLRFSGISGLVKEAVIFDSVVIIFIGLILYLARNTRANLSGKEKG